MITVGPLDHDATVQAFGYQHVFNDGHVYCSIGPIMRHQSISINTKIDTCIYIIHNHPNLIDFNFFYTCPRVFNVRQQLGLMARMQFGPIELDDDRPNSRHHLLQYPSQGLTPQIQATQIPCTCNLDAQQCFSFWADFQQFGNFFSKCK